MGGKVGRVGPSTQQDRGDRLGPRSWARWHDPEDNSWAASRCWFRTRQASRGNATMSQRCTRRAWLAQAAGTTCGLLVGVHGCKQESSPIPAEVHDSSLERETFEFIERCRREDGGYAPSPDPSYAGNSDTKFS